MQARSATPADAAAIAEIYNQGIEDRVATFETRLRNTEDVATWFDGVYPIIVAEEDGQVIAFPAKKFCGATLRRTPDLPVHY